MDELVRKNDVQPVSDILAQGLLSATVGDRYVHWSKLKHLKRPEGISHAQWWAAIKVARLPMSRQLPLRSVDGKPFLIAMPGPMQRYLSECDRDLSGRVPVPEQIRNPATRDGYLVSALIEEAITSSQLEGATSTRKVAADMLRSGRRPRDRAERMIFNNFQAMRLIRDVATQPLSPELVLDIHRRVTQDTLDDTEDAGQLRRTDDVVVVSAESGEELHHPPPVTSLEARMQEMCRFANEETPEFYLHPIVRASLLHFWLAYDHPFADGNGRTARALFYWSMLRSRYWMCEFLSISHVLRKAPAKYARSFLYTETDDNDATYFVLQQLRALTQAIAALHVYIRRRVERLGRTQKLLRRSQALNHRQLGLLGHALSDAYAEYTVTSHANSHNVTRQTARNDLNRLVELGLLVPTIVGRGYVYNPPADLEKKLEDVGRRSS